MAKELKQAAEYVRSLLPAPLEGDVKTVWEFITSTSLGGDSFGYHWIDDDHFAMYLLDVCGHGVGAALLSISAINVVRSQSLPNADFRVPNQVLEGLNETFPMEKQNDMYFTMWYGVYSKSRRRIAFSSGGHPPALFVAEAGATPAELRTPGMLIGGMPGMTYETDTVDVTPASELYIYSDGVYELTLPDGSMWTFEGFVDLLAQPSVEGMNDVQRVLEGCRKVQEAEQFEDDFSMVQLVFA